MTGRHAAPRRRRREVEDDEFAKAAGRFLAALERRASTNPDALAYMLTLQANMAEAVTRAGHALSKQGGGQFSLGELAEFMSYNGHRMSRQAAQQRWGKPAAVKLGLTTITEQINNIVRLDDWRARRTVKAGEERDDARKVS